MECISKMRIYYNRGIKEYPNYKGERDNMAKIREVLDQSREAQTKEQLEFLISAAKGKLETQKEKLEKLFLNPSAEEKIRVIPDTEIKWYDEYRCNVKEGASDSVDKVIDQFFSGSDEVKNGFKTLVKAALATILGSETAGEQEEHVYVVFMEHNAIVRVDISVWRYNYSSEGVIGHVKDAFCCTFCKSVVDHTKVRLDTLVYLISELAGDENVTQYLEKLKKIWDLVKDKNPENVLSEYKMKNANWLNKPWKYVLCELTHNEKRHYFYSDYKVYSDFASDIIIYLNRPADLDVEDVKKYVHPGDSVNTDLYTRV